MAACCEKNSDLYDGHDLRFTQTYKITDPSLTMASNGHHDTSKDIKSLVRCTCAGGFEGKMYFVVCGSSVVSLCFCLWCDLACMGSLTGMYHCSCFRSQFYFLWRSPSFSSTISSSPVFPLRRLSILFEYIPTKHRTLSAGVLTVWTKINVPISPKVNLFLRKSLHCLLEKTQNVFKLWKCTSNCFLSVVSCASVYLAVIV